MAFRAGPGEPYHLASKPSLTGDPLTRALAAFAAGVRHADLPADVVALAKDLLIDVIGTSLAATTLGAGCREVIDLAIATGGPGEASILGTGRKVAAPGAALANGALAHALNYDPIGPMVGHIGVTCLVAPLAVAEAASMRTGKPVSGRELLAACVCGAEVTARITSAIAITGRHPSERFLAGQYFSYIGAAAGAARMLGLDADRMRSAFGLALMQTAGSMQVVFDGDPPAKAVYGGFPNQCGVMAAMLAASGLDAGCAALEGPAGLYGLAYGGEFVPEEISAGLGTDYRMLDTQIKPWPTSATAHPFIEAACTLARAGITSGDIAEIRITGRDHIRSWCEPVRERARPMNAAAAANSIPFTVAKALCHGTVLLHDFTPAGLDDQAATTLAARTVCRYDDALTGGVVELLMRDGSTVREHVSVVLGHPTRRVGRGHLLAKFRDCCRYARLPLADSRVDGIVSAIDDLEHIDDIAILPRLCLPA